MAIRTLPFAGPPHIHPTTQGNWRPTTYTDYSVPNPRPGWTTASLFSPCDPLSTLFLLPIASCEVAVARDCISTGQVPFHFPFHRFFYDLAFSLAAFCWSTAFCCCCCCRCCYRSISPAPPSRACRSGPKPDLVFGRLVLHLPSKDTGDRRFPPCWRGRVRSGFVPLDCSALLLPRSHLHHHPRYFLAGDLCLYHILDALQSPYFLISASSRPNLIRLSCSFRLFSPLPCPFTLGP